MPGGGSDQAQVGLGLDDADAAKRARGDAACAADIAVDANDDRPLAAV